MFVYSVGMQETGTKLAEYCGHALLALEVLIHPRALPLLDMHSSADEYKVLSQKLRDAVYPSGDRQISTHHPGEPESEDDDLNENWLGNDDEMETQVTEGQQNAHYTDRPPVTARDASLDELPSDNVVSITHVPKKSEMTVSASGPNDKSMGNSDDHMVESPRFRNTSDQRAYTAPNTAVDDRVAAQFGAGSLESVELEPLSTRTGLVENDITVTSDVISEASKGMPSTSEQHVSETKDDGFTTIVERISAMFESDNEWPTDSLPDIVDGDPDSD